MEKEFYCIIKLVSSEEIMSLISIDENDGDPIIILQNPVVMKMLDTPTHETYVKMKPWMEIADDDIFFIKLDKVITMTETKNKRIIDLYDYYVNNSTEEYQPGGKVELDSKMGYIDSVKDARNKLEKMYRNNQNPI